VFTAALLKDILWVLGSTSAEEYRRKDISATAGCASGKLELIQGLLTIAPTYLVRLYQRDP
jgi:hypothetical protein